MRRYQGYNISKIQTGVPYLYSTSMCDIEKYMPKLHIVSIYFAFFLIENGLQKTLQRNNFVEENTLYQLRRPAPQTVEQWTRNLENKNKLEKIAFFSKIKNLNNCDPRHFTKTSQNGLIFGFS